MSSGTIIAAFATCGKTILGKKYKNVIDLESSKYKFKNNSLENIPIEARKGLNRERNEEWPYNYYKAIDEATRLYDIVLVQLKPEHFDYFDKNNIKYSIVYPDINNFDIVRERCIKRGNNEKFTQRLEEVFLPYYEDCLNRNYENMYILANDETLEDCLLKNNYKLEKWESA